MNKNARKKKNSAPSPSPPALQRGRVSHLNPGGGYGFLRLLSSPSPSPSPTTLTPDKASDPSSSRNDANTDHNNSKKDKNSDVYFRLPPLDMDMDSGSCHTGFMALREGDTLEFMPDAAAMIPAKKPRAQYTRLVACSSRSAADMSDYLQCLLSLCVVQQEQQHQQQEEEEDPMAPAAARASPSPHRKALVLRELTLAPEPLRLLLAHSSTQLDHVLLLLKIAISILEEPCTRSRRSSLHSSKVKDLVSIFTRSPSVFLSGLCNVLSAIEPHHSTPPGQFGCLEKLPLQRHLIADKRSKVESAWGKPLHSLIESIKDFVLATLQLLPREDTRSPSVFLSDLFHVLSDIEPHHSTPLGEFGCLGKLLLQRHHIADKRSKVESAWGKPLHSLIESIKDFVLATLQVLPQELPYLFNVIQKLETAQSVIGGDRNAKNSSVALQVIGVLADSKRADTDDPSLITWSMSPLVPSMSEMASVLSPNEKLPVAKLIGGYKKTEDYIETYFRLLKEDAFAALKKGISDFVKGKLNNRDMVVWSSVSVIGVHFGKTLPGMTFGLLVNQKKANKTSPKPPLSGSLLCICDSGGSFINPIWATAESCEQDSKKQTILFIDVMDSSPTFSGNNNELQSLGSWVRILHAESLVVAESPAYYRAYAPVMKALQSLDPKTMPFQEELVHVKSPGKPPAYLNSSTILNWGCLHASAGSNASGSFLAGVDELKVKSLSGFTTPLDPTQINAINHVLENRLAMIQGPPGTGKSFLSVRLIQLLLSANTRENKPILILTYKNLALDALLGSCQKFCKPGELVRVGGGSKSSTMADCNLTNLLRSDKRFSSDEKMNRDMLQNLETRCEEALIELYECQSLSIETIISNPLFRGFLHKLLFTKGGNVDEMEITGDEDKTTKEISKRLKEWMPQQSVFRAVQAGLSSIPKSSFSKAAAVSEMSMDKERETSGNDENDEDPEDFVDEVNNQKESGKRQEFLNNILTFPDLHKKETMQRLSLINFDATGYTWLLEADPWELSKEQRCMLMLVIMRRDLEENVKKFVSLKAEYDQLCIENTETNKQKKVAILKNAKIIGMTTTGAAIHEDLLAAITPSIVLVDESGEILEPQIMGVLYPNVDHLILVGDHKQLRPSVNCYALAKNHNLGISMLERLVVNNLPYQVLGFQSRMREEFLGMVLPMYPNLKTNIKAVNGHRNQPAECMNSTMYFWDHACEEKQGRSPANEHEAHMVVALSKWLLSEGIRREEISVICAYNGQVTPLRRMLAALGEGESVINVQTIDRFQGSENRIIIVSTVRSNANGDIGYLREANRLCVTVSRARSGFYICGNAKTLSQGSQDWRKLIDECFRKQNLLGETIFLTCPRHPNEPLVELHHNDAHTFSTTAVCQRPCNSALSCHHNCKALCHNGAHSPCQEIVRFTFKRCQHSTTKICSVPDDSMRCNEMVWVTLEGCGHSINCKCWEETENISSVLVCKYPCNKTLACGHPCTLLCGVECCSKVCQKCDDIKRILDKKEKELQKKKLEEKMKNIDIEIQNLGKESADGPFFKELLAEGETAAEYCMVKDRTEKFIQPDHKTVPIVRRVEKVTNIKLELAFLKAQKELIDPTAPTQLLFHGTSDEGVKGITHDGFRLPAAEANNMFGQGCYFATDSSKSAQNLYTKGSNKLLLCEVLLGTPWSIKTAKEDLNLAAVRKQGYDSVFSMRNSRDTQGTQYDEYIVYDPRQAIPRYIVHYDNLNCSDLEVQRLGLSKSNVDFERRILKASSSSGFSGFTADEMHYRFAEAQFLRMCRLQGGMNMIKEVEYTRCTFLEQKYEARKKEIGHSGAEVEERLLFHGTSKEAIDKIIREGFKVGGEEVIMKTGCIYGKGVYVAANPETAMQYAKESRMMLLSRAVCGSNGVHHNFGATNDIFVLRKGDQLLPCYIVHFN